jgi:hypothetical protein
MSPKEINKKQHLDNIEIVDTPHLAIYELKLVVAMEEYDEADPITAGEWLINLLTLAADGVDIKIEASEFMRCCITNEERRVHLCTVERVEA